MEKIIELTSTYKCVENNSIISLIILTALEINCGHLYLDMMLKCNVWWEWNTMDKPVVNILFVLNYIRLISV